ncbi:DNRLRE domain-containing protein [Chitinophaga filiformis]|uniref:DNRLRE domain-containing protein n=1 Tax=Chitinophaga filiformis TaxID=104663 RepID=UPI001F3FF249|nr:DNRLRE domain-containing protein [Chitinophaga filiformis]MCF6407914.1 DNRLRE domain-containing protein [Chitinophaga filiformis]
MKVQVLLFGLLLSAYAGYSQTTYIFQPDSCNGKDATVFVKTGLPEWSDRNFGQRDEISASGWTYGGQGGEDGYSRTFIDFDGLKSIPRGTVITSATLSLYGKTSSIFIKQGNAGDNDCFIERVTGSWDENTIGWNNKPNITYKHQTVLPGSNGSQWKYNVDVDVTMLVQDMTDLPADSSHGFCIQLQGEEYYRNLLFASSEHTDPSLRPKLTVTFNLCNPAPRRTETTTTSIANPPVIKPLPVKKAVPAKKSTKATEQPQKEEAEVETTIMIEHVKEP